MIENCCIYVPKNKINFKQLIPNGVADGGLFKKPTRFEYQTDEGPIALMISYAKDQPEHLVGFRGYVSQLENTEEQKAQAFELIDEVQMILGVQLPEPIESDSDAFQSLMYLVHETGGFMFVADSILTPDGFLVGPMTYPESYMEPAAEVSLTPEELDELRSKAAPHLVAMRDQHIAALSDKGFACAQWMPIERNDGALRPPEEIAKRFMGLFAVFLYTADGGQETETQRIRQFVDRNGIAEFLSEEELEILNMDREMANEEHRETIGWRLENMWPLAWVLGFEQEPPFYAGQLSSEVIGGLMDLIESLDISVEEFLAQRNIRSDDEVVKMEDLFYCAHNAVRSAQLGKPTVPADFHAVADGGAIHERRHSLTWSVSPGCDWDDTDLST